MEQKIGEQFWNDERRDAHNKLKISGAGSASEEGYFGPFVCNTSNCVTVRPVDF